MNISPREYSDALHEQVRAQAERDGLLEALVLILLASGGKVRVPTSLLGSVDVNDYVFFVDDDPATNSKVVGAAAKVRSDQLVNTLKKKGAS